MPKVLIAASPETTAVLERTIVWRSDVERLFAADLATAFEIACDAVPKLVILDGAPQDEVLAILRRFRNDGLTRKMSLAVLRQTATVPEVEALRRAGANVVFAGEALPYLWDAWLEELLEVPRRRVVRVPLRLDVWSRFDATAEPLLGLIVDISVKGMLLETAEPIDVGTKLDLSFRLPGDPADLRVVAQVIRQEEGEAGRARAGVEFVIVREAVRDRIRAFVEGDPGR
jgi:PilZ domain-containing protein